MALSPSATRKSVGPEPAEGAGSQHAIDESIENFFEGHAPGLTLPDAVDHGSQAVGHKGGGARNAKHYGVARAERNGVARETGDEDADDEAISKPQAEELRHGRRATRIHGQKPDRSLLEFFLRGGRLHVLVGTKRKMIETRLQSGSAQNGEELVLVGELLVVAAVIRQQHVDDGAGDKHDHSGQQDGEPQSNERNHAQPPWKSR